MQILSFLSTRMMLQVISSDKQYNYTHHPQIIFSERQELMGILDFSIKLIDNCTYRISRHSISLAIRSILFL